MIELGQSPVCDLYGLLVRIPFQLYNPQKHTLVSHKRKFQDHSSHLTRTHYSATTMRKTQFWTELHNHHSSKAPGTIDLKGSLRSRYTSGDSKVLLDSNLIEALHTKPIFLGSRAKRRLERAVWNDTSFLAVCYILLCILF